MAVSQVEEAARVLDDAALHVQPVSQFGAGLSLEDAYAVQSASIRRRQSRGERRIGVKLGFTSRAKMKQMGVNDIIWGQLTDRMIVEDGGSISLDSYIHPRVEPEIVFLIGKPLSGKVNMVEALAAVEAVAPAMEIIDSRYQNFKFSLSDVVADNASASGCVIGPWNSAATDLSNLGMLLCFDGEYIQIGSSAAILGHPARAIIAAARLLAASEDDLKPGDLVLAGAATAAEVIRKGAHVRVEVQTLGSADFSVLS